MIYGSQYADRSINIYYGVLYSDIFFCYDPENPAAASYSSAGGWRDQNGGDRTQHCDPGPCGKKTDSEAADALIGQYMGFIRSETVKFTHAAPENGHEDELSIAMLAFYESILSYEKNRGRLPCPYAARAIRNRLIDHYRAEKRHGTWSPSTPPPAGTKRTAVCWTLSAGHRGRNRRI